MRELTAQRARSVAAGPRASSSREIARSKPLNKEPLRCTHREGLQR